MRNVILFLSILFLTACSLPLKKTSNDYLARGQMYYKTGKYKKALNDFNKAIEKDNYNMEAYASRGVLLFDLKQYHTALSDFGIVLRSDPNSSEAYSAIGAALAAQGRYNEARESLMKALELNPSNVEAICSLGGIYYSTGVYKAAVEEYTKAINLRPAPQIYFERGVAYKAYGKNDEAEADYKAAGVKFDQPQTEGVGKAEQK